uniref:NADH-ubiquinone oxidoreductase chain 4L n=1 Tax=Chauliognathus opacus TaxID=528223 RepID=D1G5K5_CHAOP|nr:NADH dehydrogenase subunit 4L [Chauliognathus opacus]ACM45020.1 NADH dehydrogenase subunit 4L [Chauliognathus opacus]
MKIFMLIFFVGLYMFCLKCVHLLLMLMSLELIVVSLYLGLLNFLVFNMNEYYFLLVFLTMSVCESTLGLSILVSLIRSYGSDFFQIFNVLW